MLKVFHNCNLYLVMPHRGVFYAFQVINCKHCISPLTGEVLSAHERRSYYRNHILEAKQYFVDLDILK